MEAYTLFLIIPFVSTLAKLVRVSRLAPPFKLSRQTINPALPGILESSANSLKQWIGCTFLAWGMLLAYSASNLCSHFLYDKGPDRLVVASVTQDVSAALMSALLVILSSFLSRWHMMKRIERLRSQPLQTVPETDKPSS
jgi:hypothetical protein